MRNDKRNADDSHRCQPRFQRGCASARAPRGNVDVKSLPMSVQQTINQQASGGEIVEVKREDDPDGRWNYELVARTSGKEWASRWSRTGSF
jgi:hypothetical protein